jgi:hypothetical protein
MHRNHGKDKIQIRYHLVKMLTLHISSPSSTRVFALYYHTLQKRHPWIDPQGGQAAERGLEPLTRPRRARGASIPLFAAAD